MNCYQTSRIANVANGLTTIGSNIDKSFGFRVTERIAGGVYLPKLSEGHWAVDM